MTPGSWSSRNPCSSGCLGSKVIWRLAFGVRRSAQSGLKRSENSSRRRSKREAYLSDCKRSAVRICFDI